MRKPRSKKAPRPSPGGPGGMASLRRAQEKLKAMGIKPWKAPEPQRPKRAAAPADAPTARTAVRAAPGRPPQRERAPSPRASPAKRSSASRRR